jgi:hypothetical protein
VDQERDEIVIYWRPDCTEQPERASLAGRIRETAAELAASMRPQGAVEW